MSRSEGLCLGYGPPCDTVCFKARYYALSPIIGCVDMPRGTAMPRLPLIMLNKD